MKKVLYFMFAALAGLFASCTNEEKEPDAEKFNRYVPEVLGRMSAFNDSLLNVRNSERTRVNAGRILDRMVIVSSDVLGAYELGRIGFHVGKFFGGQTALAGATIGGLIGGVSASYAACRSLRWTGSSGIKLEPKIAVAAYLPLLQDSMDVKQAYPKRITLKLPADKASLQDMGARHNLVLANMMNGNLSTSSLEAYLTKDELYVINSDEYKKAYDLTTARIEQACLNQCVIESSGDDVADLLMNLFYQVLEAYPENSDDVEFILNKYIEAVSASEEIPDTDKDIIFSALSVAASSYEFWENGQHVGNLAE